MAYPIFFDEKSETISTEELRKLQLLKLQKAVSYAITNSIFYREKKKLSIENTSFESFEEFSKKLPYTTKEDLINCGTYENLCVSKDDIIEVHFSSGTSAKPVASFLTRKDIVESNRYLARTWYMQGIRKSNTFAMLASYGLFSAGMINHYALQEIGAFVIPVGGASMLKTLSILDEFNVDSCAAVASFYPYMIRMAEEGNRDLKSYHFKYLISGGEPLSEQQRAYVEGKFGANLLNQYGMCEINTGLAGECSEKKGLHILADYVYPEVIDPVSEEVLKDGEEGELVLTTFHKEASPLIRYKTGDITSMTYELCKCGRTMPRISSPRRKEGETLFYKGIKIQRAYISNLMEDLGSYLNPYIWQMRIDSADGRDELKCKVALTNNNLEFVNKIEDYLKIKLDMKVRVEAFGENELQQMGAVKFKNFLDNRKATNV